MTLRFARINGEARTHPVPQLHDAPIERLEGGRNGQISQDSETEVSRKRRRFIVLLENLIGPQQQRRRDRETERLGGLGIDYQIELCRLFDGNVARSRASKDSVDIDDT
jgi:hypothetical protein